MFLILPQHRHRQYKVFMLWKTAAAGVGVKSVIMLTARLIAGPGSGILQQQHLQREQDVCELRSFTFSVKDLSFQRTLYQC